MARQQLLELTMTVADPTGTQVRTLRLVPGGGPGPDDMDLNEYVAMFWGELTTQTPADLLGGFYRYNGTPTKAEQLDKLWNGSGLGDDVEALPAIILKNTGCIPVPNPEP